jgi:hypothetical protein
MRSIRTGHRDSTEDNGDHATAANDSALLRVVIVVMLSGLLTLGIPDGVRLPALSALLFCAAFVTAAAAAITGDSPFPHRLTRWDEAAALAMLSLLVGWLSDVLDGGGPGLG